MCGSGQAGSLAELGGGHWALLPALFCLPWLSGPQAGLSFTNACFLLLAAIMAGYDLASRRIPNSLNALAAAWGILSGLALGGSSGLIQALLGGLTGFSLLAVFFFLGAVGAGDVKSLAALGTFLGPAGALKLFIFTTLTGGLMALLIMAACKLQMQAAAGGQAGFALSPRRRQLPYGLAIWAGAMAVVAAI